MYIYPSRNRMKRNPLSSTADFALAGLATGIVAVIAYAIYSKNQTATTVSALSNALSNPFVNAPQSQASQAAYNAWAAGTVYGSQTCPPGTTC